MHTFKDTEGREWRFKITLVEAERMIEELGIDIGKPPERERIFDEMLLGSKVLWLLLGKQIMGAGLTAEEFKEAIDGPTFDLAARALRDEILFFARTRSK